MNSFTPRKKSMFFTFLLFVGLLICLGGLGTDISALYVSGIVLMIVSIVLRHLLFRCPFCKKPLGKTPGYVCPHCKTQIDEL